MYLHVLARLEGLAADGAGVRQVAGGVHVEDVLLEVAVVAVELAAVGTGGLGDGLTVSEAGPLVQLGAGAPGCSGGSRDSWADGLSLSARARHTTDGALPRPERGRDLRLPLAGVVWRYGALACRSRYLIVSVVACVACIHDSIMSN